MVNIHIQLIKRYNQGLLKVVVPEVENHMLDLVTMPTMNGGSSLPSCIESYAKSNMLFLLLHAALGVRAITGQLGIGKYQMGSVIVFIF